MQRGRLEDGRVHDALGLAHEGRPLGFWVRVAWDPRRYLPPYGEAFVETLVCCRNDRFRDTHCV